MLAHYGQQTFFHVCVIWGESKGDYLYFIPMQKSLTSLFSLYLIAAASFFNLLGTIYIEIYEDALVSA